MRKITLTFVFLLSFVSFMLAQTPQAMSYQAVARDLGGNVLANKDVSLRISILGGSITGAAEYVETHDVTTNQFGLINIQIGKGNALQGEFASIQWGASSFYSKIEIDIQDGNGYQEIGTSQMLAVPYALYAAKAHETDFNFIVTGMENLAAYRNDSASMTIMTHLISGEKENVEFSVSDVPTGVTVKLDHASGEPDFLTMVDVLVSEEASAGEYPISISATATNGLSRNYNFNLKVDQNKAIFVTVKDASTWTPENPDLDHASGATVMLYESEETISNNNPSYTTVSDASGVARFYDLPTAEYYFVVEKDDLSNVIEGYLIEGVFQSQEEVDNSPQQNDAKIGGLKFRDANGDGLLNDDDKTFEHIYFYDDEPGGYNRTITIGKKEEGSVSPGQGSEQDIIGMLEDGRNKMKESVENEYIFDGIFTNTSSIYPSSWDNIKNHNIQTSDYQIKDLWSKAYQAVHRANTIIKNASETDMDPANRSKYISEAKAIRAYMYYNLGSLFGGVPLVLEPMDIGDAMNVSRVNIDEVYASVENDLQEASSNLPVTQTPITSFFAKGMLLRTYMQQQKWAEAVNKADEIINSGYFSLSANPSDAFTSDTTEIIYGFEKGSNTLFNQFFDKGTHVPVLRYTEVLLLKAEALNNMGNVQQATEVINMLKERRSLPILSGLTQSSLSEEILNTWQSELANEGNWFFTLKRFNKAVEKLGIQEHMKLLPIPQSEIDVNPNMIQNPGY